MKKILIELYNSRSTRYCLGLVRNFILKLGAEDLFAEKGQRWWFFIFVPRHKAFKKYDQKKIIRNNITFLVNRSDYAQWFIWAKVKEFIPTITSKFIKEGGVIFDIGANVGNVSLNLAQEAYVNELKRFKVYAFEPNNYALRYFQQNTEANYHFKKFIEIQPVGLGSEFEAIDLYYNRSHSGCGSVGNRDNFNKLAQKVQITTLDFFVKESAITRIDLIKVDVEGFELSVLKGSQEVLYQFNPYLIIEINLFALKRHHAEPEDILNFLMEREYLLFTILSSKKLTLINSLFQIAQVPLYDILAAPRNKADFVYKTFDVV